VLAVDRQPPGISQFGNDITRFYGWGKTERNRIESPLLFGKTVIAPDDQCPQWKIALCGWQIARIGIKGRQSSQCHGDSGGPLVWFRNGRVPVLIGVVSHNVGKPTCGKQKDAGVFTRVAAFVPWIEGITGPLPRI
jgi:Trypsin